MTCIVLLLLLLLSLFEKLDRPCYEQEYLGFGLYLRVMLNVFPLVDR